jgi:N-acetylmuramoyl-L-alanine amidase
MAVLGFALPSLAQEEVPASEPGEAVPEPPPTPVERLEQRGTWQWHVLRDNEREYVRFSDIHKFYKFEQMDVIGDEVVLESPSSKMILRFLAGLRQAQIKDYKGYLSFAPVRFENRLYLSRVDLSLLIDPIIRPSTYNYPGEIVPTVLLKVSAENELAAKVASHVKHGLEAFGMQTITGLPTASEEEAPPVPKLLARLHLTQHPESDELWTQTLAPYGSPVHGETTLPEFETRASGNTQDRLNVVLGMSLHSTMMQTVEGVLDGGLRRTRSDFLKEAGEPAASISIPAETTAEAEVLGAAIVRGIRNFRGKVVPKS